MHDTIECLDERHGGRDLKDRDRGEPDEASRPPNGWAANDPATSPAGPLALGTSESRRLALVDWFIPDETRSGEHETFRRARVTICVSFIAGFAVLAALIAAAELPDAWAIRFLTRSLGTVLVATPLLVKAGVPLRWLGHGLVSLMTCHALSLATSTGGRDTGGFFLAIVIPLPAILLLGSRTGAGWAITSALGMASPALAFGTTLEPIVLPQQDEVARWGFWGCIVGIAGTCAVAITYESLQAQTVERLVAATAIADREHARRRETEASFRADLERLVEQRTAELMESREQLRHADRLASIGTLAAGVAHQINDPVGSILLGSRVALADEPSDEREQIYREALQQNVEDAKRCGEIVRNLLRFARSGTENHESLDLSASVDRAIASLRTPGRRLAVKHSGEPLPLLANPVELEQVILNLVVNAAQSGATTVSVTTRRANDEAWLEVRDDGHGIRDDDRARLFDPFFTTRTREGGTGLGLSVVHRLVEDHGDRIDVDTKIGRGTRFLVALPLDGNATAADPA